MYKAANRNKILIILIVLLLLCLSGLVYWYLNIYLCNVSPKGYEFLEKFIVSKECHTREYELRGTIYNVKDNGDSVSFDMNVWGEEGMTFEIDKNDLREFDMIENLLPVTLRFSFNRSKDLKILKNFDAREISLEELDPDNLEYEEYLVGLRTYLENKNEVYNLGGDYASGFISSYLHNPLWDIHLLSLVTKPSEEESIIRELRALLPFKDTQKVIQDGASVSVNSYVEYKTQDCKIVESVISDFQVSESQKKSLFFENCSLEQLVNDVSVLNLGEDVLYSQNDFLDSVNFFRINESNLSTREFVESDIFSLNEEEMFGILSDISVARSYYPEKASTLEELEGKTLATLEDSLLRNDNVNLYSVCRIYEFLNEEGREEVESSLATALTELGSESISWNRWNDPNALIYCVENFKDTNNKVLYKWRRSIISSLFFSLGKEYPFAGREGFSFRSSYLWAKFILDNYN